MIDSTANHDRDSIASDLLPDLTPLLDVMFMLIIFLVLTTNTMQQAFDVTLPHDNTESVTPIDQDDAVVITIFANNNKWAIGKKEFTNFNQLQTALLAEKNTKPNAEFIIFGDKAATIDKLMSLLTFMRANGIEAADIAME